MDQAPTRLPLVLSMWYTHACRAFRLGKGTTTVKIKPKPHRFQLVELSDGVEVSLPPRRSPLAFIALTLWLLMWSVDGVLELPGIRASSRSLCRTSYLHHSVPGRAFCFG